MAEEIFRCQWATKTPAETVYHDTEWGRPLHDDRKLFEKLVLESMQTGLSWSVILSKRENFREAFDHFEIEKIIHYDDHKIDELMTNTGLVRNRRKLESVVNNAKIYASMLENGETLNDFFWKYVDHKPIINHWNTIEEVPGNTPLSETIAKELKSRGFKYVGPTTVYSLMQSSGMVNDHLVNCHVWQEITDLSK